MCCMNVQNSSQWSYLLFCVLTIPMELKSNIRCGKKQEKEALTHHAAVLCRCWSSGSSSRARTAPLRPAALLPLSPTAPPSQHTIFTWPRSRTQPPRPWHWSNLTPMTFLRSPWLSMRVGVSTGAFTAGENTQAPAVGMKDWKSFPPNP